MENKDKNNEKKYYVDFVSVIVDAYVYAINEILNELAGLFEKEVKDNE